MNELGEVSIDSSFVPENTPVQEMLNGCICCSIQGELSSKLYQLLENYELDAIYIEATGAAHPMDVLDGCTHLSIIAGVKVKAIITVVDAKLWHNRSEMKPRLNKLIEEQAKYADVVVLNKIDTVVEDDFEQTSVSIREFNPGGLLLPVTNAAIDPLLVLSTKHNQSIFTEHTESHVDRHLHLRTFTQQLFRPLDRIVFEKWLKTLPGRVFRGKGFVQLNEAPGVFMFQYAYGEPMFTRCSLNKSYQPVIVLIGDELDHERIREQLLELQYIVH